MFLTFLYQEETGQCPVRRSVAVTGDSSVLVAASTQLQECSHYTLTILPRHPNTQVCITLYPLIIQLDNIYYSPSAV